MVTKMEILNKLYSQGEQKVLKAIEELRVRGWLADGTLRGIALCYVNLSQVDFMEADLCNVDFHQANLEYADFSKAKLKATKFTRTNLHGANFDQADLTRADLYKANLRDARNLTNKQLSQTIALYGATMQDGKPYNGCYKLESDLGRAKWAKIDTEDPQAMADYYGVSLNAYMEGQEKIMQASPAK